MKYIVALVLFIIVTFSSYGMFLYSTRARRANDLPTRIKNRSLTNVSMAVMLISISFIVLMSGTLTPTRIVVFILFLLVALFNLYFGLKNIMKKARTD